MSAGTMPATRNTTGADTLVSIEDAARRLDVEVGAVRQFVRQRLLRLTASEPAGVWHSDVERLCRVLARQSTAHNRWA
jgi:hypothetical protein